MPPDTSKPTYYAFISYSHADEEWAHWLHKKIETYRVPKRLLLEYGARDLPRRLFPLFRDREELPTSADLGGNIRNALETSRYLIVICSPNSARSRWVKEEIVQFKTLHGSDRVLCFIVAGEPHASEKEGHEEEECFSDALKFRITESGEITDQIVEPVAADARPGKDGRKNAFLKMIAGLLGVRYDSLKQRDRNRARQRKITTAAISTAILIGFGFLAVQWRAQQGIATINARQKSGNAAIARAVSGDYARSLSELHSILDSSGAGELAEYKDFYNAWVGRFSPLEKQLKQLSSPSLFRWRTREYFRNTEGKIFLMPEGQSVSSGLKQEAGYIYSIRETAPGKAEAFQLTVDKGKTIRKIEDIPLLDVAQLYRGNSPQTVLLAGRTQSASAGGAVLTVVELNFKTGKKVRYSREQLDKFTQQFRDLENITLSPENLAFPEMVPESAMWMAEESKLDKPEVSPEWHSWLPEPAGGDADPVQRLCAAADWGGIETSYDSFFTFLTIPFGDNITVCAMGSNGAQYGVWQFFRIQKDGLKVTKDLSISFHGDFGDHRVSADRRYFYIQNLQYLSHPTFDLVDLENLEEVTPEKQPSGAGPLSPNAAFSADFTHFAMLGENGAIWLYQRKKEGANFTFLHSRKVNSLEGIESLSFLNPEKLLLIGSEKKMVLVNPASAGLYWSSAIPGLEMSEEIECFADQEGAGFCLFDGSKLQIFHGGNGAPLSSPLSVRDLVSIESDAVRERLRIAVPEKNLSWRIVDIETNRSWMRDVSGSGTEEYPLVERTGFVSGSPPKPLEFIPVR
ncbi:MAG: toll/interleukin-1 receptor domain-containing protein [Verrucomicrobiales bacterium]|nr:toll/interleukin-1 receptor domain-containing protein [Verrucomicrobiales bacterium]